MQISQGELIFRESEQECAERLKLLYGLDRALTLTAVFVATATSRVFSAYFRGVESWLGQFAEPRKNQSHLQKESELRGRGRYLRGRKTAVTSFSLPPNTFRN